MLDLLKRGRPVAALMTFLMREDAGCITTATEDINGALQMY